MTMNISQAGMAFIADKEKFRGAAYQDSAGVWTIGYGHTGGVVSGQTMTEAQGRMLFVQDLQSRVDAVNRLVTVPLTQNQFDTLVSFVYNIGEGSTEKKTGFAGSKVLRDVNSGNFAAVPGDLLEWTRITDPATQQLVVLPGLVNRRNAEISFWNMPAFTPISGGSLDGYGVYKSGNTYQIFDPNTCSLLPATLSSNGSLSFALSGTTYVVNNGIVIANLNVSTGAGSLFTNAASITNYSAGQISFNSTTGQFTTRTDFSFNGFSIPGLIVTRQGADAENMIATGCAPAAGISLTEQFNMESKLIAARQAGADPALVNMCSASITTNSVNTTSGAGNSGVVGISPPSQEPIGAFYESVTPANDLALSIASKTPVILDSNNNAITAAQLQARDVNADGKLSGTELANLKVWIDQSEDGIATNTAAATTELTTLASYLAAQGFSSIRNTDYQFYTKGNASFIDASQATASVPSSGYDALRNTNNHRTITMGSVFDHYDISTSYTSDGYFIYTQTISTPIYRYGETVWKDWTSSDIKQTNDDTTLIGTSGNDNFGAGSYSGTSWLPSGQLVNFMAGAGDDVVFGSTRADNIWGGTGNDDLLGDAGNDKIYGEEGNDRLFGGAGDDLLLGGDGNDLMLGFNPSNWDQTLPAGATDNDTMYGGNGDDAILGQLGDDKLFGEAGNDEIQGGDGNDQIYGGDGNDRMFGGSGDDLIYGGAGDDVIVGFNPTNWDQTLGAGQTDNNTLYGGAGNDVILGGVGNDYIDGGQGADYMQGGKGDDTYIVNSVNDTILEQLNEGYDTVISSSNYILNFGIEELRLLSGYDINATGNSENNLLIGNERDNILDGVTGADTMIGGAGNDTYYVDNAGDQVIEQQNEGTDRVQSSISYTLGQNLENLVLLDFSKPEHGLVDGTPILVYGYPKANELDYMQGNAPQGFKGTCALTSISNLMTQANQPTTEEQVVQVAIDHHWAVTTQDTTDPYKLGGSNYLQQQAILASFNIRNDLLAGYNADAIANLIQGGRGVIVAVNAGQLWSDANYTNSEVGQCAKQRRHSNKALLARPSGDCLAGHDGLQASNDMAWRAVA